MIVLVGGGKGGTGKSTLSINLASFLAKAGVEFVLLDGDKQRTASKWVTRHNTFNNPDPDTAEDKDYQAVKRRVEAVPRIMCVEKLGKDIYEAAKDLESKYGIVIIDTGGRDSLELRYALGACHVFLCPVSPTQFDIETLEELSESLSKVRPINPHLNAYLIISMAERGRGQGELMEAKETLPGFQEFTLMDNVISRVKAFRKHLHLGLSVFETTDNRAIAEIQLIAQEVFRELQAE